MDEPTKALAYALAICAARAGFGLTAVTAITLVWATSVAETPRGAAEFLPDHVLHLGAGNELQFGLHVGRREDTGQSRA